MKKFNVENAVRNSEQILGHEPYDANIKDDYVGDYIEADTAEEAIEYAIDSIVEAIRQNSDYSDIRVENEEITVYDDEGNAVEEYFNFTAIEIE